MALQSRFLQGFGSLIFWGFCTSFLDLSGTALHGTGVLVEWARLSYVVDSWTVTRTRVRRFAVENQYSGNILGEDLEERGFVGFA
jgi:hypothetical protein